MGRTVKTIWTEALAEIAEERCVVRDDEGEAVYMRRIEVLARNTFDAAIGGDMAAAKEISNRLEGTPRQFIEMDADVDMTTRIIIDDPRSDKSDG